MVGRRRSEPAELPVKVPKFGRSCRQAPAGTAKAAAIPGSADHAAARTSHCRRCGSISSLPLFTLRRYNDRAARVVKLVDTVDLKSTDAETRRAGSSPALGTPLRRRRPRGMRLAKSPRSRGRKSCFGYLGIGHAASLTIAIRLEIERNGQQASSVADPVVEARRVNFPARLSTLAVIFESPTNRWPKKSFAT
jgi:hypothetical protein